MENDQVQYTYRGKNAQPSDKDRISLFVSGENFFCACTKVSRCFDGHHLPMNVHPKDKTDMKRISTDIKTLVVTDDKRTDSGTKCFVHAQSFLAALTDIS